MPLFTRLLRPAAGLLAAAALPVAAGCGGSGGDPTADPAAIVPARAPIYFEVNLDPGDDVTELARKLSGEEDPGGAIKQAIEREARQDDPDFRYSEHVEPWLGERIGVYIPRINVGGDAPVALVMATKDADEAKERLEAELRSGDDGAKPQITERSHRDTDYLVDTTDNEGVAIVDDYAVFGDDLAIKGVIDAREGESLAENSEYEKARGAVEADSVGFFYLRLSQLFSSLGPQGAAARQALQGFGDTIAVGVDGDPDAITVESAALGAEGGTATAKPGEVLGELPASAWAAAGLADVGTRIEQGIEQLTQLGGITGQDPEQLLDQLERQLGIDPRRDLGQWMGDVGFFVFGDSVAELGGGLVARTKDASAAISSFPRLVTFFERVADMSSRPLRRSGVARGVTLTTPRFDRPIHMVLTNDERFIVAIGDPALAQTLQETDALGDSQAFKDAAARLGGGMQPTFFANFAPIVGLLEGAGVANDPTGKRVLDGLKRLTTLAAGTEREGDIARGRLVIGVK